jgi:hypothetical protein
MQTGQPESGRDLLPYINNIVSVGPKTLKIALGEDPRIDRADRKWSAVVSGIDSKRPMERAIVKVIEWAGIPLNSENLGRQLAAFYPREEASLTELVDRLIKGRPDFFAVGADQVGLSDWLLKPNAADPGEVEFENFEDPSEIDELRPLAERIDWENVRLTDGAIRLLDLANRPVSNKALQFFLWQAKPQRFDAQQLFRVLSGRSDVALVSPALWAGPQFLQSIRGTLDAVERNSADVELTNEDVPKPVSVEPEDIDALSEGMTAEPVRAADLLSLQFSDLHSGDPNYNTTLGSLDKAIRSDSRFMWVGWDRFTSPQPVPPEAKVFPSVLLPVVVDIEISAGQQEDIELEDEGLEGTLVQDIQDPLVKYGGSVSRDENGVLRVAVTYGHRQSGTLPVGDDGGIFPKQPDFLLVTTRDEAEESRAHWANNELRLMYNLGSWYASVDLPQSGGVFTLEPIDGPGGNYLIAYSGETHPEAYLEPNRIKDLLALKERAVAQETSTREIIQEILRHHSKGVTFRELYAEVIVARMTSARMIASILSSYYEFYAKGASWLFNERDAGKGFKKQKKKYIIKR